MATLSTVYATDEDVAVRASGDYIIVCPADQKVAVGNDGVLDSAYPWQLTSATGDFVNRGLASGHVVQLGGTTATPADVRSAFGPSGDLLVVDSVESATVVNLRRLRQATGVGMAPAPLTGTLTAVPFKILTFSPQIEENSFEVNQRYGIDATVAGRSTGSLFDIRELQQLTVLGTLRWAYWNAWRNSQQDAYKDKARAVSQDYIELRDRLSLHWKNTTTGQSSPTTAFTTRLSR